MKKMITIENSQWTR